jgi:hypothetical protein
MENLLPDKTEGVFLLLLRNRLNTMGMRRRRNMVLYSYYCELCFLQHVETLRHMFLHYLLLRIAGGDWGFSAILVKS